MTYSKRQIYEFRMLFSVASTQFYVPLIWSVCWEGNPSNELQMNIIENDNVDLKMNLFEPTQVLVTCYATLHPALSVRWCVGPSLSLSVCPLVTLLFVVFGLCSCPIMAPAHPHKTGVAVDPALFVFVIC